MNGEIKKLIESINAIHSIHDHLDDKGRRKSILCLYLIAVYSFKNIYYIILKRNI